MKYTIQIGFVLLFMLNNSVVRGQQNTNVLGHSATINSMHFDYSIGEMALITTQRNTNIIVTQGLLQPIQGDDIPDDDQSVTHTQQGNTHITSDDMIKVYPNPTENILNIESIEIAATEISYQLFDALGKLLMSEKVRWQAGVTKFPITLKNFAAGSYFLMIHKPDANGTLENFAYKIQKTN